MKTLKEEILENAGVERPTNWLDYEIKNNRVKVSNQVVKTAKDKKPIWDGGEWNGGTWQDGYWNDGTWNRGNWNNGRWLKGTWNNGTWNDGIWNNGEWNGGVWKIGWIYDPNLRNRKIDKSWKTEGPFVRSPVSPKEYFKIEVEGKQK